MIVGQDVAGKMTYCVVATGAGLRAGATVETEFARNPTAVGVERQILGVRW